MRIHCLDLDGSLIAQPGLFEADQVTPAQDWGPRVRLACSFRRFRQFEQSLTERWPDPAPQVVLYGSGDFHHVSLALLRRLRRPCNLVVIDNHPDWMCAVPFLHCGTWLYHAARLPHVGRVFHLGGDVDFDNAYRWLAPRQLLRSRKTVVFPSRRRFGPGWADIAHEPLRPDGQTPVTLDRILHLLQPFEKELAALPLYISLDKDVMIAADAAVNWDSGHLTLAEVGALLAGLEHLAHGRLVGMDIVGDWSVVRTKGLFRRTFHWCMHPPLPLDAVGAAQTNLATNQFLLSSLCRRNAAG